jgi:hypothetical protein
MKKIVMSHQARAELNHLHEAIERAHAIACDLYVLHDVTLEDIGVDLNALQSMRARTLEAFKAADVPPEDPPGGRS